MAIVKCAECGNGVSTQAFECPQCGAQLRRRKRGFFGKISKWSFVIFNAVMAFWLVSYWLHLNEMAQGLSGDAEAAGAAIGGTIGSGILIVLWVAGAIILGLFTLFTRPKGR